MGPNNVAKNLTVLTGVVSRYLIIQCLEMRPPLTYLVLTYAELNLVIGTEAIKLKVRTIVI